MPETKSFCTYEQQLQILKRRGLSIADDALALQWLREKNYYRLSAYSLTLRHKSPSTGEDEFLKDSSFSTIIDLYQFDEQFRAAISHAAAIAETNLKAYIAYYHARQYGPVGYLDGNHFEDPWRHAKLLNGLSKSLGLRKDEPFVLHHHKDLNDVYPVWVIVEVLTFDQVSMMYRNLLPEDRAAIAREFYGISSREYIETGLIVLLLLATSLHMVPAFIIDSVLILPQECLNPSILTAQNHSDMYMLFGIYFPFLTAAHLSTPFMIAL